MTLFASDCMDEAASLLNDTAKAMFTYTAQLPYLKKANEDLELIMIANGASVQRQRSTNLLVVASTNNIVLSQIPDMFVPINVWERASGSTDLYVMLDFQSWEPNMNPIASLQYWTFRNNTIIFPPVQTNREVRVDYWRQLLPVTQSNSIEEILMSKTYLSARTAELCARYIGENESRANALRDNEVSLAQDNLETIYVKNNQSSRGRRRRFSRNRTVYAR